MLLLTQSMPFTLCVLSLNSVFPSLNKHIDYLPPPGILIALMVLQGSQSCGMTGTDNCKLLKRADWSIITGSRNQKEKISEMSLKKDVGKWRIQGHMQRAYA